MRNQHMTDTFRQKASTWRTATVTWESAAPAPQGKWKPSAAR
jgi:hypothetical protein